MRQGLTWLKYKVREGTGDRTKVGAIEADHLTGGGSEGDPGKREAGKYKINQEITPTYRFTMDMLLSQ